MRKQPNDPERTRAAERLFKSLSDVDEEYLREAEAQPKRKSSRFPERVGSAIAAVLCAAVLGAGYYAVQLVGSENRSGGTAVENVEEVMPESSEAVVTEDAATAETELLEQPEAEECDPTGASQESASTESAHNESEQANDCKELTDELSTAVGAGMTQGNENTMVGAPADESAYEEAQSYSAEVEEIQTAISQAMADGKLPFVIKSVIYENPLRIVVTVNTTDETLTDQVKTFDPSGKIIEIVYSDSAVQDSQ